MQVAPMMFGPPCSFLVAFVFYSFIITHSRNTRDPQQAERLKSDVLVLVFFKSLHPDCPTSWLFLHFLVWSQGCLLKWVNHMGEQGVWQDESINPGSMVNLPPVSTDCWVCSAFLCLPRLWCRVGDGTVLIKPVFLSKLPSLVYLATSIM